MKRKNLLLLTSLLLTQTAPVWAMDEPDQRKRPSKLCNKPQKNINQLNIELLERGMQLGGVAEYCAAIERESNGDSNDIISYCIAVSEKADESGERELAEFFRLQIQNRFEGSALSPHHDEKGFSKDPQNHHKFGKDPTEVLSYSGKPIGGHLYEQAFQNEPINPQNSQRVSGETWSRFENNLPNHRQENEREGHLQNQRVRHDQLEQVNRWNDADAAEMRRAGNEQDPVNVRHIGFETFLNLQLATLEPSALLENLGTAKQRVACRFANDQEEELVLPTHYLLRGQWNYQEDRNNTQDIATLRLSALINGKSHHIHDLDPVYMSHNFEGHVGPERPVLNNFSGGQAKQTYQRLQRLRNTRTGQVYEKNIIRSEGPVFTHQGHEIIYVEPFELRGAAPRPRHEYEGNYQFDRLLEDKLCLAEKKQENLIYSNGTHIYLPKVTQELWTRDQERIQTHTGFFIASYKQDQLLNFMDRTTIQGLQPRLSAGLYQLLSVQDGEGRRTERWQRLGEYQNIVEILSPIAGVSSIPGMGGFAPRVIPSGSANAEVLALQENIHKTQAAIKKSAARHPHVTEVVVVVGPSDAGKSTLIQGLAGKKLVGVDCGRGYISLDAEDPLPDFKIGQDSKSQTKIPGFWYDQDNNRLVIDCPGFEDSEGGAADIVNAFAIKEVFPKASVKVVLVAGASRITSDNGTPYAKLLNQMTALYQDQKQLKEGLSVVLTKTDVASQVLLKPLFRLLDLKNTVLTDCSKNLLTDLNENRNRFFLLPKPQDEGDYHFDRDGLLDCINTTKYAANPGVNISVGVDAENLAIGLAQGLNKYLTNYIKTEGSQRIINYCNQLIDEGWAAVDLRAKFGQLATNLQQLPTNSPRDFLKNLKTVLDKRVNLKDIKQTITTIDFLKTINKNIVPSVANWKESLQDTITKINTLTVSPTGSFKNGILSIDCIYTGAGEIFNILNQHPGTTHLNVCALNTLFLGQSDTVKFERPGMSMSLIAPQWKIDSPVTINLSGAKGSPGASGTHPGEHGKPGEPGGNGGHFFGLAHTVKNPEYLTINTSGGTGGPGGNGAVNGSAGAGGLGGVPGFVLTKEFSVKYSALIGEHGTPGRFDVATPSKEFVRSGAPAMQPFNTKEILDNCNTYYFQNAGNFAKVFPKETVDDQVAAYKEEINSQVQATSQGRKEAEQRTQVAEEVRLQELEVLVNEQVQLAQEAEEAKRKAQDAEQARREAERKAQTDEQDRKEAERQAQIAEQARLAEQQRQVQTQEAERQRLAREAEEAERHRLATQKTPITLQQYSILRQMGCKKIKEEKGPTVYCDKKNHPISKKQYDALPKMNRSKRHPKVYFRIGQLESHGTQETQIPEYQYKVLKEMGCKNIKEVDEPIVIYYHRKRHHPIPKEKYDQRKLKPNKQGDYTKPSTKKVYYRIGVFPNLQ